MNLNNTNFPYLLNHTIHHLAYLIILVKTLYLLILVIITFHRNVIKILFILHEVFQNLDDCGIEMYAHFYKWTI
jgi:hypothetical protein